MPQFLILLFCAGLIASGRFALKSSSKWPAKLMLIGSLCISIPTTIIIITLYGNGTPSSSVILPTFIFVIIGLLGLLLYLIGLISYCAKTFAAMKANEQLDYLNFQLKDQLEARTKQAQPKS